MGWYIVGGILLLAWLIWPRIEARLRPAHIADLEAGRKCIRCGQPISEGDASIAAYGHRFGLAHLECEKDGLERAGYGSCLCLGVIILFLLMFVTCELPDIVQGKMRWTDTRAVIWILALIVVLVRERFDTARWRRRMARFLSEHPRNENESEQDDG